MDNRISGWFDDIVNCIDEFIWTILTRELPKLKAEINNLRK